ncbi:tail protein X [Chitinophaga sp. sic0106]|uniref:tail protein X n=1 Tax=Chitinophaga sp. sic0106 TaxID=2854785 RepID=UPI001C4525A9|nr:tail protein X [Chitinophaga sp. sic0106]
MNTEYVTKPGDRWDLISYKAYGTVEKMGDVVRANPAIPIDSILPEGLLLVIPLIPASIVQTDKELLPPWKQ